MDRLMSERVDEIRRLRMSGRVKRWHTVPILGQQTVAEHCAQALTLLALIHPNPSATLMKCVLWHDSEEIILGDMPANGKKQFPAIHKALTQSEPYVRAKTPSYARVYGELTDEDRLWIKFVDVLEFIMFSSDQLALGNRHASTWINRGIEYMDTMDLPKEAAEFWDAMLCEIHQPVKVL